MTMLCRNSSGDVGSINRMNRRPLRFLAEDRRWPDAQRIAVHNAHLVTQ